VLKLTSSPNASVSTNLPRLPIVLRPSGADALSDRIRVRPRHISYAARDGEEIFVKADPAETVIFLGAK
jgi:hypothetical protein